MIKSVAYSLPGKIIFSASFCSNSSAFDRATVSLKCQSGQAYWRSGPGGTTVLLRITVQKQTIRWARERTKIRISRPKNEKNFCDEEGNTPSPYGHTPLPYTLGACGASIPDQQLAQGRRLAKAGPGFEQFATAVGIYAAKNPS